MTISGWSWVWLLGGLIVWPIVTALIIRDNEAKDIDAPDQRVLAVVGGFAAGVCLPVVAIGGVCLAIGYGVYRLGLALAVWPPEPSTELGHWADAWVGTDIDQLRELAEAKAFDDKGWNNSQTQPPVIETR